MKALGHSGITTSSLIMLRPSIGFDSLPSCRPPRDRQLCPSRLSPFRWLERLRIRRDECHVTKAAKYLVHSPPSPRLPNGCRETRLRNTLITLNHPLKTFAPLLLARKRIEFYEIKDHEIVHPLKPTLIDDFLNKTGDHWTTALFSSVAMGFSLFQGTSGTLSTAVVG